MDVKAKDRLQLRFLILFILCLQFNNSTLLSFHEGDYTEIVFQYYDMNNTVVSLHVSNRPMFYQSGTNMSMGGLTTEQHSRFSVEEKIYKGDGSHKTVLMVRVKIINVTREDAGTFFCYIHQNGEIQDKLTKIIGLQVEFPPGKATCEIENSFGEMNGVWVRVHCKAPLGSLHGFIDCYQEGEKMPPWTRPVQDRKTLEETLWIKRAHIAHCCTSNYERPTERCSCKDFGWDPIIGIIPQDKIDPCAITQVESNSEPTVLSTKNKTLGSHSSASNQPLTYASTTTVLEDEDHKTNNGTVDVLLAAMVTVICVLLMVIFVLVSCLLKSRNNKKNTGTSKDHKYSLQTLVPIINPQTTDRQVSKEEIGQVISNPIRATEDEPTFRAAREKKKKEKMFTKLRAPTAKKK